MAAQIVRSANFSLLRTLTVSKLCNGPSAAIFILLALELPKVLSRISWAAPLARLTIRGLNDVWEQRTATRWAKNFLSA